MTEHKRTWLWWLLAAVGAGLLLHLLSPILTPFLFGALLAYVASPFVARLERWHIPRVAGVILVFVLFILAIVGLGAGLIPQVQNQLAAFGNSMPGYLDWIQSHWMPWLNQILGGPAHLNADLLKTQLFQHWSDIGSFAGMFLAYVTHSGVRLATWILNLVLVPVVTFYLLRDWDRILQYLAAFLPPRSRTSVVALAHETDRVLAAFLRGQISVMIVLALVYSTGLWLVGVDLALPIGLLAGLASFVPYLGFITGLLAAGAAAWLQFQNIEVLAWVGVVFASGQALESMVLTPYLVGGRIGLHPVAVIFAVMAGGQLFGFMGVLLALPAAATLAVIGRQFYPQDLKSSARPRSGRRS